MGKFNFLYEATYSKKLKVLIVLLLSFYEIHSKLILGVMVLSVLA